MNLNFTTKLILNLVIAKMGNILATLYYMYIFNLSVIHFKLKYIYFITFIIIILHI